MKKYLRTYRSKGYKYLFYILFILIIFTYFHPLFMQDESFTFGLVNHHLYKLIELDSMDVHPPLYYILLKIFLSITTFWTNNIIVKIIFARIFSIIAFIIFIRIGLLILSQCNVHKFNKKTISIIFLLFPLILINVIKIRMYSLSSLFVMLTFYKLIIFVQGHKIHNMVLAIIFSIFSAYTFYFSGLSSGLFFVIFILFYLYKKEIKYAIYMFISGLILLISYIPWLPVLFKQIKYHLKSDNGNSKNVFTSIICVFSQLDPNKLKSIILGIIIIFVYTIFIVYSFKIFSSKFNIMLFIIGLNLFLTVVISLIVCGTKFQVGAIYPIYSVFIFFIVFVISKAITRNDILFIIKPFIALLILCSCAFAYKNIKKYDIPTVSYIRTFNRWNMSSHKSVTLTTHNQLLISEDAIYLKSIHKDILLKKCSYKKLSEGLFNGNKNPTLAQETFNNLKQSHH